MQFKIYRRALSTDFVLDGPLPQRFAIYDIHRVSKKTVQHYFLSEVCQISTNCEHFWHKDRKEDKGLCVIHSFSLSPVIYVYTLPR